MRELLISESAVLDLRHAASDAHPVETGGILIGVYANGKPWITHAVEVRTSDRGPRHFTLPAGATGRVVGDARALDPRLGYLGEWHVHPADVGPSSIDRATMKSLVKRADGGSRNPILLLARRRAGAYELEAREWRWQGARHIAITTAGDLDADPKAVP